MAFPSSILVHAGLRLVPSTHCRRRSAWGVLVTMMLFPSLLTACLPAAPRSPPPLPAPGEPAEYAGSLAEHNRWRAEVGTPALVWSDKAARRAQNWADQLAREGCEIRHSPAAARGLAWGENIYGVRRGANYEGFLRTGPEVVARWAGEKSWYDAVAHRCQAPAGETCGHYTQLVSTFSTHVGCGRARCKAAEVWVCAYAPPGNYDDVPPF